MLWHMPVTLALRGQRSSVSSRPASFYVASFRLVRATKINKYIKKQTSEKKDRYIEHVTRGGGVFCREVITLLPRLAPRIHPNFLAPFLAHPLPSPAGRLTQPVLIVCCHRVAALLSASHDLGFSLRLLAWGTGCLCGYGLAFGELWQGAHDLGCITLAFARALLALPL